MVVATGTTVLQGTTGYYGYYGTTNGYYVVPVGTMVVPQTGYYRVLQACTAEGMSRVMVRVRLGVCTPHARYLSLLIAISNKMARAFAEVSEV